METYTALALSQRVTICLAVHKPARYNWNGFSGTLAMWVRVAVAIGLLLLPTAVFAQAEKRIALLIGNQGYGGEIGRLANPHNDVALLEKTLKALGFEVRTVRDAGLAGLHRPSTPTHVAYKRLGLMPLASSTTPVTARRMPAPTI